MTKINRRIFLNKVGKSLYAIALYSTIPKNIAASTILAIEPRKKRTISFMNDRSMGRIFVCDIDGINNPQWQYLGEAIGTLSVPTGKAVILDVSVNASRNLSSLKVLKPEDLQKINLCGTEVSDLQLANIITCGSLHNLQLSNTPISNNGLVAIKELPFLRSLHLCNTQISDEGLKHISKIKSLYHLSLSCTQISNKGLAYLAELDSLHSLRLNHTKIDDDGLYFISKLTSLKYLHLSRTNISNEGLNHLRTLRSLSDLRLNHTQISNAGLVFLTKLPQLKTLFIKNTHVTNIGFANLHSLRSLSYFI